jgi:DNA topoisomerase-1
MQTSGTASQPNTPDGPQSAKSAGLRYVSHFDNGIQRRRHGKGFIYFNSTGKRLRDPQTLDRIRSLVIPPAWSDLWICPDPRGHIQAIGKDQRGRKQYRYHPLWRKVRDESKFDRVIDFAKSLPRIRRHVRGDLRLPGLPRQKVLGTVVLLLEKTLIRVGNEEYARSNHSYGLTTMKNSQVDVTGSLVHFEFRGKSGVEHAIDLHDHRLAKIIRACQHLSGQELFEYVDGDGARHPVASDDVNGYLQHITQDDFTAKDFRTWAGTVLAAVALREQGEFESPIQGRKFIVTAIKSVAKRLGNTTAVCRKCYVHPFILEAYLNRTLLRLSAQSDQGRSNWRVSRADETIVIKLLRAAHGKKAAKSQTKPS